MNYTEAFELAVKRNAETRHTYFIYKMIWTNEYVTLRMHAETDQCFMIRIGEVRRRTPR